MKTKLVKTILVFSLIMTIAMLDFMILGANISIAIAESNMENVEFVAYLNQQGEVQITEEQVLNLEVKVKDTGVLNNAKIKIENANFELLKDKIQNSYIKNINMQTNEIELNSIVYETDVKLEIPIQFKKKERFEADYFQREIIISLEGNYKKETEQKVEAQRRMKINWTAEADILVSQTIRKYRQVEGIGTILQQEVTTEVTGNKLPRENETLFVQVPILEEQQPRQIYVIHNGIKLSEEKVQYTQETNLLQISDGNDFSWENAVNNYQIIYIYPEAIEATRRTIELNTISNTKLFTKEAIQKQETKAIQIEPMGNLVSIQKIVTNQIDKGYLYAKTGETIFTEENKIQISNQLAVDEVELTKAGEYFSDATNEYDISNQVSYRNTIIRKEEFSRILGPQGQITITDENNQVLAQINQETAEDEKGNIIISYGTEVNKLKVTTSKPITEGEFSIFHTRNIQANMPYTKEQLKTFGKMISKTQANNEIATAEITLNDTKTEAKLEISNPNLSTLQTNENIQLLLTLKSDSAAYDLYKNPTVKMILPTELSSIQVKNVTPLNLQEEMTIINPIIYESENGEKVIEMTFQGEQTHFENTINQGIQVSITADITTSKTIPTKTSEIKMIYTNENRPNEEFNTILPIHLNSKYGVLMVNTLANYNTQGDILENIDDKVKIGNLDIEEEAKSATQKVTLVNNYESEITDIVITGEMPEIGEKQLSDKTLKATFETTLLEALQVKGKSAKISYSEDRNTWQETIEDMTKVKAFKVELIENHLKPQEIVELSYQWQIPENIKPEDSTYSTLTLSYHYLGNEIKTNSSLVLNAKRKENSEELKLRVIEETGDLKVEVIEQTGGQVITEGQPVYEGQGIQYRIRITNQTEEEKSHIHVKATNTNAIYFDRVKYDFQYGELQDINTEIRENEELRQKDFDIETIKPKEAIELEYQIAVKEVEGDNQTVTGGITISGDQIEEKTYQTLEIPIQQAELKLTLTSEFAEEIIIGAREGLQISLKAKNITNQILENVIVELPIPEEFDFFTERLYIAPEDNYEFIDYKDKILRFKIPTLDIGEVADISIELIAKAMPLNKTEITSSMYFKANVNDKNYISNSITRPIQQLETSIIAEQTSSPEKLILDSGDQVTFTITMKNEGPKDAELFINDKLPDGLVLQDSYFTKNGEKTDIEIFSNVVNQNIEIKVGESIEWTIHAIVDAEITDKSTVTNYATFSGRYIDGKTNEITYQLNGKKETDLPSEQEKFSIEGEVWKDKNQNALKETVEERVSDVTVMLVNEETGEITTQKTQEDGRYEFTELLPSQYTVLLEYDTAKYYLTEYQKEGIDENSNSDFVNKTLTLQGKERQVAATKTITLQNQNLKNIDAGLIEGKIFDFKLDKYINRILRQDAKGTIVKQYDNEKLAKIELDAKRMANSNIIIEYKINVTNEGDMPGYASELVDYIPKDLQFNSEINKAWYQGTDGNLYTKELANQIIYPGETKTIMLTLMKRMTQNNTGTVINTAEISKATNDLSLKDIDSTAGNKIQGEDDMSTAEVIISIRTGGMILYISLFLLLTTMIGMAIYIIKKDVLRRLS